jgi:ketosteroid isomerase-like protein
MNDSGQPAVVAISQAEEDRCAAISNSNWAALAILLADEFSYTHSSGRVEGKAEQLARLQEFDRAVERLSMRVRVYGDVAVTNGEMAFHLPARDGKPASDPRLDVMQAWVRRDGRWQLVAHHGIRL